MSFGQKFKEYLLDSRVDFDLVEHRRTGSSSQTAQAAHIPGDRLAKAVVLQHDDGYVLAVVPSTHRVELGTLERALGCKLNIATEAEVGRVFGDCALGAVPPAGPAYDLTTLVDEELDKQPDVYFESGDHRTLVHVTGDGFRQLMAEAQHAQFSHHV
jgi:Ala-tRNA(Pro) deacylase